MVVTHRRIRQRTAAPFNRRDMASRQPPNTMSRAPVAISREPRQQRIAEGVAVHDMDRRARVAQAIHRAGVLGPCARQSLGVSPGGMNVLNCVANRAA